MEVALMRTTITVIFFLLSRAVSACQCSDRPTIPVAAARSDIVAIGTIAQLTIAPGLSIGGTQLEKPIIAKLIVDRSWGRSVSTLDIVTGFSDCDYRKFVVGGRYLVFAEYNIAGLGKHEGMAWAPRCLPTQRRESVSPANIRDLGEPLFSRKPDAPGAASATQPTSVRSRVRTLAVIVIIVIVASALMVYRQRAK